jgi:hypothetical protein
MATLFLDANILLDFYRFGSDDISEIDKLLALINDGNVKLISTSHLKDEVLRNREDVVSRSLSELRAIKFGANAPNYCRNTPEFTKLSDQLKIVGQAHNDLVESIEKKIRDGALPADNLIRDLLSASHEIEITSDLISRAQLRISLGNPPGKNSSLGDALHWESLLATNSIFSISLVTRDKDFASPLDRKKLNEFLTKEWKISKLFGKVELFPSLSDFFRTKFPFIKLSTEEEKRSLIGQLENSPNFASTHDIIGELSKFDFFTNKQIIRLFKALVSNSQVGWIATDVDLQEFYFGLQEQAYIIQEEDQAKIAELLEVDPEEFFEIKF